MAGTAAVLGVTLVAGFTAVLIFLVQIRTFIAETSAALELADERAKRLAGHVERMQTATGRAATELAGPES